MSLAEGNDVIWEGRHVEEYRSPQAASLSRINYRGEFPYYLISIDEGPFSGYPELPLSREKLEKLYQAIGKELYPTLSERQEKPKKHVEICGETHTGLELVGSEIRDHEHVCGMSKLPEGFEELQESLHVCGVCGMSWRKMTEKEKAKYLSREKRLETIRRILGMGLK